MAWWDFDDVRKNARGRESDLFNRHNPNITRKDADAAIIDIRMAERKRRAAQKAAEEQKQRAAEDRRRKKLQADLKRQADRERKEDDRRTKAEQRRKGRK